MFSNCLSVHGVPIEAERSQSSSKTLKDSLICILDDVLIQILLNIKFNAQSLSSVRPILLLLLSLQSPG